MAIITEDVLLQRIGINNRFKLSSHLPIKLYKNEHGKINFLYVPYTVYVTDILEEIYTKCSFRFPVTLACSIKIPNIITEIMNCSWNERDHEFTYYFKCLHPFKKEYAGGHIALCYTIKDNKSSVHRGYEPLDSMSECAKYCNVYNENFRIMEDFKDLSSHLIETSIGFKTLLDNIDRLYCTTEDDLNGNDKK